MSSNFSWFLRFIIYIPLMTSIVVLSCYYYLTNKFDQNLDECLQYGTITPSTTDRKKMVPFVSCLKKKSNFFLTKMMDENRLYQYAYPKLPCSFVGKWHVSADMNEYWQTINKDASFVIEPIKYGNETKDTPLPLRTGVWSSATSSVVIQFLDDSFFWPINQSKLEWIGKNQFALHNGVDSTFYYHRHSELDPSCVIKN